ncbi:MAG: imidazole glycerol phosphate synthase subunit HisH [Planctomycetota bacterium]|nr:imidazole glycerol phosphate synthase subunit HisH [Planctomycetota bacterium]MDA1212681.1 imidazole glycerol phosphate synthase subunit HisH [Planctomycetota bacterium]
MITIVDYGMGNLRSVQKACEFVGTDAHITSDPAEIVSATKLILPGVGAFRDAIHELTRLDLVQPVKDYIASDKPFLGICLGLQLLFDVSYEEGEWQGLGVIPGKVVRFPEFADLKVPHMGWNTLNVPGPVKLLENVPETASFYFVHSYYVVPDDESVIAAQTEYGVTFTSMIARGNMYATQFHPEKSQKHGLQLIKNFVNLHV